MDRNSTKLVADMTLSTVNKTRNAIDKTKRADDKTKHTINLIFETVFFMFVVFSIFHLKSYIGMDSEVLANEETAILRFVVIFGVIFLLRFPIYFMLELKGYIFYSFIGTGLIIYYTKLNMAYAESARLYDNNYIYLAASALYLIITVAYIYSEIYFSYYDNGIYRTKYDVFLNPDYKFKIWHRLFNGFYILVIVWFILSETYVINLNEYFIAVLYIIINVCICNTFAEKVIISTGHRGNRMVLLMQFVFLILGIILIINYFSTLKTMNLFIGVIYVLSFVETLFLCRYKVVK